MNGFFLVLPILLVRYGVFPYVSKEAFKRAAFFPPTAGMERIAYWVNYVASFALMLIFILYRVKLYGVMGYAGLGLYVTGLGLYLLSILQYAKPDTAGLNTNGLYRISRNPMYTSFFLHFAGGVLLVRSWAALAILLIYQAAAHYLILSEERWCIVQFGDAYKDYMRRVRRYL